MTGGVKLERLGRGFTVVAKEHRELVACRAGKAWLLTGEDVPVSFTCRSRTVEREGERGCGRGQKHQKPCRNACGGKAFECF